MGTMGYGPDTVGHIYHSALRVERFVVNRRKDKVITIDFPSPVRPISIHSVVL